jgi:hypothetical protein
MNPRNLAQLSRRCLPHFYIPPTLVVELKHLGRTLLMALALVAAAVLAMAFLQEVLYGRIHLREQR